MSELERAAYRDLLTRLVVVLKARHTTRDSAMAGAIQACLDQFGHDEIVDLPPGPPVWIRTGILTGILKRKASA